MKQIKQWTERLNWNIFCDFPGLRPKIKNHYRAHQLSVWLRLVPELHRAGMEDVDSRHNLFRGHSDPGLYDGSVRPDPLSRISEEFKRKNITTEPPTTTDYSAATCVSYIQSTNLQNVHNASTDTLASLDAAGCVISIPSSIRWLRKCLTFYIIPPVPS